MALQRAAMSQLTGPLESLGLGAATSGTIDPSAHSF